MNQKFAKSLLAFAATTLLAASPALAQNIAVVNGKPIPKTRLTQLMEQAKNDFARRRQPAPPDLEARLRQGLIQETVNVQQAERLKLHLTPEYAERMTQARGAVLTDLLFEQYKKDHPISDEAARKEYDRVIASMPPPDPNAREYHARHILVKTETQARQVLGELAKGGDFAALAAKHSVDTGSAQRGGDLDWAPAQTYVPEFAKALQAMKKGETSKAPVRSQFGYHIIRLEDERSARPPAFELVKDQIKQEMQGQQAQAFGQHLQELVKKARIQ
ncbi:MAG: peptidylprolyl isomerase [Brachymonas sp.]|nr:peptidylprolyl isomerase [Brachymonas sp.]